MDYALAKKLKDAGLNSMECQGCDNHFFDNGKDLHKPTLEELIDACGEKIRGITKDGGNLMGGTKTWGAWAVITHSGGEFDTELTIWGYGRVPLIAVANLYLALNK